MDQLRGVLLVPSAQRQRSPAADFGKLMTILARVIHPHDSHRWRPSMIIRLAIVFLIVATVAMSTVAAQDAPITDRIVAPFGAEDGALFVHGAMSRSHFRLVVNLIGRAARVPVGFAEIAAAREPHDGDVSRVPMAERVYLTGLTIGAALDHLVAADPRYAWREIDGVLLIRPVRAWNNQRHFLGQRIGPVHLRGWLPLDMARAVYRRAGLPVIWMEGGTVGEPARESEPNRPLDLDLADATYLDLLNAIARTHGELGWAIEYAADRARLDQSCVRFMTFDGKFVGQGPVACD